MVKSKTYRNEAAVAREIDKVMKKLGIYVVKYTSQGMGKSGVPDFIISVGGHFIGLEAKLDASKNPPTQLQMNQLLLIEESGGTSIVVDQYNVGQLEDFLAKVKEQALAGMPTFIGKWAREYTAATIELGEKYR